MRAKKLLLALLLSCASVPVQERLPSLEPVPEPAEIPVDFREKKGEGLLCVSYEGYRALEKNVIELRLAISLLREQLKYYSARP